MFGSSNSLTGFLIFFIFIEDSSILFFPLFICVCFRIRKTISLSGYSLILRKIEDFGIFGHELLREFMEIN